ncbi:ribosome maturation factor RimM [Hwanghaeella sp.]|uniref:ribosome maturation factor RimM n=1 Tax=Hwanghaeella sp. TaxID=2605943 RepID=UPI003CCBEDB5
MPDGSIMIDGTKQAQDHKLVGDLVLVGVVTAPHGVRGLVKVKSFTEEPSDLVAYGALSDQAGRKTFQLEIVGEAKGQLIARVDGIADRNAAEDLKGQRLFINRSALPETEEDEFYHADLIGLRTVLADGNPHGRIKAVYDFGAGDLLEVSLDSGGTTYLPFTREVVPVVDIVSGSVTVIPPAEVDAADVDGSDVAEEDAQ